jgi:hypothetical protein
MKISSMMMNAQRKREKDPIIWHFLHIYTARPEPIQSKLELMGIHRFPHPSCRPDIVPCDFWLFRYLKMKLEGMLFDTPVVVLAEVEEILRDIGIPEWVKAFDEWKGIPL